MELPVGIIFGLLSMLGFGMGNALAQIPVRRAGVKKTIFYRTFFTSIMLFITLMFFISETEFSGTHILVAFCISILAYFSLINFYKALRLGKVGIIAPIANSSVIFTVLFSIIFFKESLSNIQIFSIFLIITGIILISINLRDLKNSDLVKVSSGIPFALATCLLWAIIFFLFKIPVTVIGPILTTLIVESGAMLWSGINLVISKEYFRINDKKALIYIFITSIFVGMGGLFFNFGITTTDVSIIAVLSFSNPLISILYGKFVFKEEISRIQWMSFFLILIGIALISYFSPA